MLEGVELRELRVFLVLAEELHFGRTAHRFHLTASRVSQIIRTLEARLGGPLFERTSRRVRLTPVGEQLRDHLAPTLADLERGFHRAREALSGVAGTLRLGLYATTNGGPHLLEIVKNFETRHPDCRVEISNTGFDRDQLDWLRRGDVDLLAIRLPLTNPDVVIGPILSSEPRVLAVAVDHPLADRTSVTLEDLADYEVSDVPSLPRELMDAFIPPVTPSGKRLPRIERRLSETAVDVALGKGVHPTVPSFLEHYPHPGVTAVPMPDLPASKTALVWLSANRSAKTEAFARVAEDVLESKRSAAD